MGLRDPLATSLQSESCESLVAVCAGFCWLAREGVFVFHIFAAEHVDFNIVEHVNKD